MYYIVSIDIKFWFPIQSIFLIMVPKSALDYKKEKKPRSPWAVKADPKYSHVGCWSLDRT